MGRAGTIQSAINDKNTPLESCRNINLDNKKRKFDYAKKRSILLLKEVLIRENPTSKKPKK